MACPSKRKLCSICGETFSSAQGLSRHQLICDLKPTPQDSSESSPSSNNSDHGGKSSESSPSSNNSDHGDKSSESSPSSNNSDHGDKSSESSPSSNNSDHGDKSSESSSSSNNNDHDDESDTDEIYMEEQDIEDIVNSFQPSQNKYQSDEINASPFLKSLVMWTCLFICLWQSVFYISTNSISILLQFLHGLLATAAEHYHPLSVVLPLFPSTIYMLQKMLKLDKNNFKHYVVCRSCFTLYTYDDCVNVIEGQRISKTCTYVNQPNHPMKHYRQQCGTVLLRIVKSPSEKERLVPFKSYYYKPLKESLQSLITRSGFQSRCELWRHRKISDDTLSDVYDGQIWKDFTKDFLKETGNYGLMLNVDWFQPFKHVRYSVGVIYMVILNLPREQRFKRENIILVGVIPHIKKEPPTNTFVQPLVDDLEVAWSNGFSWHTGKVFRLALMCIGCDIPACRKLCGFLGHMAVKGCSRCKTAFPGVFGKRDFSGFQRDSWVKRTHANHIKEIRKISKAKTKAAREALESQYGTRYSVLSELPYVDLIRMSVVDPMHNLFLGTAKHMLQIWKDTGVLTDKHFDTIQLRCDQIECPNDIGRIPHKISSGFAAFSADQFKNWTLLFSIYALKGVIGNEHLECWRLFVLACQHLCSQSITLSDVRTADILLLRFCVRFENLYGKERVTPNMHLHGHLRDCILDFGPLYSFWLFSFERCNGMMGEISTNNKTIELQLMRRFLCHSSLLGVILDDEFGCAENLLPAFNKLTIGKQEGTVGSVTTDAVELRRLSSLVCDVDMVDWTDIACYEFSSYSLEGFTASEKRMLLGMYKSLYDCDVKLIPSYKSIKTVKIGQCMFGTGRKSSRIMAYWTDDCGQISWNTSARPGTILKHIQHDVIVSGTRKQHQLVQVQWYTELPTNIKNHCGKPVEAWHPTHFVDKGPSSYMPIQRIKCRFVASQGHVGGREVMFLVPRNQFVVV